MPPRSQSQLCAALAAALFVFGCASSVEDRIAEVRALQDGGQFSESVQPLRELLAKHPDQPEANYLLGVALVQTGQPSLAVWPLEKASGDPSQALPAGLLLASTFLSLQSHEDAVRIATKVLDQDPSRVAALKIRAQARLGANDREAAVEDTARLRELVPDDYQSMLLHATILAELGRMEEAEKAHDELETIAAKTGDAATMSRGCLAHAAFFKDNLKDDARAEQQHKKCLEKAPTDPLALRMVTQFYDERQRGAEATVIWEQALKEAPENLQIRGGVANRYESMGKADQALALHKEGVELLGSAQAWYQLADFERRRQHSDKALEAIEQAVAASPSPNESLLFFKADLLVDLNRLEEAETLANGFKEPSFRDLQKGRILLARGDAQGALETFESGLKRWPNNAGGRYLAGLAAHRVGDFARAESEFREAVRADPAATDAAYALATIYLAQGRYKEAAEQSRAFVSKRGGSRPEGYLVFVRAATALGNHDGARRTIDALREAGFAQEAERATIEVDVAEKGFGAAVSKAKAADLDLGAAENEALLRTLVDAAIDAGDTDQSLALMGELIAKHPDSAPLHEISSAMLVRLGKDAEAKAALDKAAQLDPANARVKASQATLLARAGDTPGAIALFDEAAKVNPGDSAPAYAAAQLALGSGDTAGARQRLEEIVKRDAGQAGARNDLAWLLAQSGSSADSQQDLDRALALAEEAYRIDPSPEIADTVGYVLLQRGQVDRAVELFQEAVAKRPNSPSIRYHLGIALGRQGQKQQAADTLRQALETGPFPEADAAKSELARLEAQ